jgi:lysophospholipase L1-like esterase
MMKLFPNVLFAALLLVTTITNAQPFASEIAGFKKQDSIVPNPYPGRHPVVFTGSSSFRMWKDVTADFPGYPIINRGFGGSTFPDVIRYANEVIFKYAPKQVVIYCGDNDLASSDSVTAAVVLERFKTLFRMIREYSQIVSVVFVSIKPSPSRVRIQAEVVKANALIKDFLKNKKNTGYVDVYSAMLNADGSIKKELFLKDDLHMNAQGYAIWQRLIAPYLLK